MRLYEPVHDRFERFCRARTYGEMAPSDLINETLLVAFSKIDELKNTDQFLSFLCGIALRILSNNHRKKRPESGLSHSMEQVESTDRTESRTEITLLHEALAKLPTAQRESLILFEISGFSIKEVAALHGVGESAVKQRLKRGRAKLRELLSERAVVANTNAYG